MANEVYVVSGTSLLISGLSTADHAMSIEGNVSGTGQISDQIDLGSGARPYVYQWSCEAQFQAVPTVGVGIDLYIATAPDSDATQIDGDVGNSDALLAAIDDGILQNLTYIGSVISENAAADEVCVANGEFSTTARYLSIIAFNNSGAAVAVLDSKFRFDLQPKYSQGQ